MTSIQANQDRQDAGHALHAVPLSSLTGCDQCGRCGDPERACGRRVPALLMTRGAIETLRAVEMKSMALSPDDVRCMVDTGRLDDGDDLATGAETGPSQLALNF